MPPDIERALSTVHLLKELMLGKEHDLRRQVQHFAKNVETFFSREQLIVPVTSTPILAKGTEPVDAFIQAASCGMQAARLHGLKVRRA